jgi:hypothetical protein
MKLGIYLLFFLLQACSQAPVRGPASTDIEFFFGEIDIKKSQVKVFPPELNGRNYRHYFYLELKDKDGTT